MYTNVATRYFNTSKVSNNVYLGLLDILIVYNKLKSDKLIVRPFQLYSTMYLIHVILVYFSNRLKMCHVRSVLIKLLECVIRYNSLINAISNFFDVLIISKY